MRDYIYYTKQSVIRNTKELNLLSLSFKKLYDSSRPSSYHMLSEAYLGRFDLVSYDVYKTPYYWWVILISNNIKNPFDNSLVGSIIKCPNILDIYDFLNYRGT